MLKTKVFENQCETSRTGKEFRDHQVQLLVLVDKKMDVLKGGVKELIAATETELSSSDPMPTHFPLSHSPEKVMFTNLLLQNGLPQHDT